MKKVHMIVQTKDVNGALEALRGLGSVHVEHQEVPAGSRVEEYRQDVEDIERALNILKADKAAAGMAQQDTGDWRGVVRNILELSDEAARLADDIAKREARIRRWEPWGDFDPKAVEALSAKGVHVQLCAVPKERKADVPGGVVLETIFSSGGIDRCVALSRAKVELPFETVKLPAAGLAQMNARQKQDRERIEEIGSTIAGRRCTLRVLENVLQERRDALCFEEVAHGMREDEALAVLKGFCPDEACAKIEEKAKKEHWAVAFEDPSADDAVPTLIRNPKWVEWINPVFRFIDTLPGYREKDVSLFFLIFFSIFFGMLIGDAAYGLVYFLLTAAAHKKWGSKTRDHAVFYLLYLLSGMTVLWGVMTGTFLGQNLFPTVFQPVVPWLTRAENVMKLCFLLGAVQLSIAHAWRAILKAPHISFLSEAGWITILWGIFFLAKMLVLGEAMPGFVVPMFVVGGVLVVFFTKPALNPFKALGTDFVSIILNAINSFADLVSYIRLFAVGLATVSVADAFNELALGVGFGTVAAGLFASVILVFGHTLNIVLGLMSVLVHGLRLNLLEFGTHLEMEWAGFRYNPFRVQDKEASSS